MRLIFGWSVKGGCRPNWIQPPGVIKKTDAKFIQIQSAYETSAQKKNCKKACPPATIMKMENGFSHLIQYWKRIKETLSTRSPSIPSWKGKKHVWSWSFGRIPCRHHLLWVPRSDGKQKVAWKGRSPNWNNAASPCQSPEHWLVNQTKVGIVEAGHDLAISYGDTHL